MSKQKVSIEYKYRGSVELPDNTDAKDVFFRTKQAYANHEKMSINLVFSKNKLSKLRTYQKGGSEDELENLKKENKKLKTTNIILAVYVIASLVIMLYNNYLG